MPEVGLHKHKEVYEKTMRTSTHFMYVSDQRAKGLIGFLMIHLVTR